MDALLQTLTTSIRAVAGTADEAFRRKTIDVLRSLQSMLETPEETMQRTISMHLNFAIVRTALDLNLYNLLAAAQDPLSVESIAKNANADRDLTGRLLRHLASIGYVKEYSKDTYTANQVTKNLTDPNIQASIKFFFDVNGPVNQATPEFLKGTGYKNPSDVTDCPFNKGHDTQLAFFPWVERRPELLGWFFQLLQAHRSSTATIFESYPFAEECKNWNGEKPLFVDIGGANGGQCVKLKEAFPDLKGDVILQDLPHVIEIMNVPDPIKKEAYDFFTPEPVQGAKYYYLRAILHDWHDEYCVKILNNIRGAMGPDSIILLDEMVLPETDACFYATQADMLMMTCAAGMERSEEAWAKLVARAGLKIDKIVTYTESYRLSGIALVKA